MKCAGFLIAVGLLLAAGPTFAADNTPPNNSNDLMNRLGRALQNDTDRDRDRDRAQGRDYRDDRTDSGSSGYDRRGEDPRYDERGRYDERDRRDSDPDRSDYRR